MAATVTDGWMVTQHGKVLAEHYYGGMHADTSHLLMSVSKSLVGMVVGALVGTGRLEPGRAAHALRARAGRVRLRGRDGAQPAGHALGHQVLRGLPGPAGRGATDRAGHRLGAAHRARTSRRRCTTSCSTLQQERAHGGPFEYRSCETDVLGWVCEAASRRADARADVSSCCGQARCAERRDHRRRRGGHRHVRRRHQRHACAIWSGSARCSSTAARR